MVENRILAGDFVGFVAGLKAISYPLDLVYEAFLEYGLPLRLLPNPSEAS
jgi:hypothetical protein